MKKMKKLLSALLAVAMLMSMVLPVSAEGIAVRVSDFELLEAAPAEEIIAPAPEVEIEEVTVEAEVANANQSAETITVGETKQLVVAPNEIITYQFTAPESGYYILYTEQGINYGSSQWDVADSYTVNAGWWNEINGMYSGPVMKAEAGKLYEIYIENVEYDYDMRCTLTLVKARNFEVLEFEENKISGAPDGMTYLSIRPQGGYCFEEISWASSDQSVAVVVQPYGTSAMIGFTGEGTATITATSESGLTATCTVTVKEMETITGNSFDVSLPADGQAAYLYTPAESGTYLFYLGDNTWSIGFTVYKYDDNEWIDRGDWANSQTGNHGNAFALTGGTTYRIVVDNYDSMDRFETVSIAKAVPYDNMWIEGNSVCYVGDWAYLNLRGTPDFAMEPAQWTVSNPNVVEVRYTGATAIDLIGLSVGTTTVTATTASGKTASFELTVKEMPTIGMGTTEVEVPAGSSLQLGFTVPESGNYIVYRAMDVNCGLYFQNTNSGDWNSDDGAWQGVAAELTAGEQVFIGVENWRNYDQTFTIAIAKAVPYEHIAFKNAPAGFVGEETYVQITGGPGFAYNPIQWSSSNPSVASITWGSGTGANFMCHAVGTTTITATTSNGLSVSYEMKVTEMPTLKVGETVLLEIPFEGHTQVLFTPAETGTYIFEHAGDQYFGIDCRDSNWNWFDRADWTSSDGTRRGYSYTLPGGTTYTLEVYNWNVQGIAELELTATKAVPYTKLAFVHDSYTGYMSNYESVPLLLDYAPEYGGEELIVKSSNENVVVPGWVSGDRIYLNPVATGTATVTISTVDGRLKDTCTVTIKEPIAITSGKEQSMTIESAGYALFKFTPTTSATYAFYCVDNDYFGFSVHDENGNWIETEDRWANNALIAQWEAVAGKTYYIPFNNHGEAKNTFKIGIGQSTKATSMTIPAQDFDLYPHLYFYLQPVFAPVLGETEAVTWTSSNEKVAKFNKTYEYDGGYVDYEFYAAGAGTATITATSESGMKASVKITVKTPGKINTGSHSVKLPEWELITYQFTAPETGNYVISDETADCTVGWIMANEAEEIFVEGNNQAPVKVYLEKGQTVYPVVSNNTEEEMTFKFTIAQAAHEHELEFVEAMEPNYIEPGNIAHYACICGNLYADADGKTALTEEDVVIPKLVLEGTPFEEDVEQTITFKPGETKVYNFTATENGEYVLGYRSNDYLVVDVETADGEYVEISNGGSRGDANYYYVYMTTGTSYIFKIHPAEEKGASCEIAFGQERKATAINFGKSNVTAHPYESITLTWDFGHILAMSEEVTLTSSNPAVVDYVENKDEGLMELKAFTTGTAVITATTESGLKDTCTITVQKPKAIGLGEHTTPALERMESISYSFTPEVSGKYDIYLTSEMDFRLSWSSLSMSEREFWMTDDYVGFRAYLEAGETYSIWVQNFYTSETKAFTFWLSEAHEHEPIYLPAKAPTYTEDGYEAHFACACGARFADQTAMEEITFDSVRIPMLIQIAEGKAEVPKEVIDDFVAEVEQGGEVSIPVAEAGTNSKEEVKSTALPVESLTQIAEKEATLTVEMPTATVTMDTAVLAAVVEKAGENATVTLEVAEVAEEELTESQVAVIEQLEKKPAMTISAELLVNDQPIASKENGGFGENAKVTVKIPVGPGKADYTVLYIADDGTVENIPAVFENGFLILELEHFSDYAIIKNTVPGDVNDDGDINVLDLMYLANYFAKGETINKANADVNADGTLNVLDLMYLANFFAGKETTLG